MKANNKPHSEDRVEKKESFGEKHSPHKKDGEGYDFGHAVMDSEAHSVKSSKEKQKMGNVKKQDYFNGVGEPPSSVAHLPHHNPHDKGVYLAEGSAKEERLESPAEKMAEGD